MDFILGDRKFNAQRALIIAELGTAHGSSLGRAKELVDAAGEAGADCVKFQMVYAGEILHPRTGEVALPGGKIRLYERFRQLETGPEFFAEMKAYAEARGLLFLCTPFGLRSARELRALNPALVKIASPELNYSGLLREIASWDLPVLLSTGVSKLGDIEAALEILENPVPELPPDGVPDGGTLKSRGKICLLHCVTAYPAPETDYNLRLLRTLSPVFGLPLGLSDHSLDPELVPALGISQGAALIEKHFCLSRDDPGLDDPIALPPRLFAQMVRAVRRASGAGPKETLAAYRRDRGAALVEAVLGTGIKTLAPSERANYTRTNRSIHALRDIAAGEILQSGDFAVLRTEKNLRPGLPPSWEAEIPGRRARRDIPGGEGIEFEDI
ncbi:MAG: N-acetylneuraminate synthase family protein [Spirochaetaceae bacterium]|jgi:sialic acid synthase SpsE|nr:N-acetylneuraminate synthase family protein [Spirochaetaceae bacterium]